MSDQNRHTASYTAALPVVFSDTFGHFMPARDASSNTGVAVLFVSAWGFEEMSSRRFIRHTAEVLSHQNIASLRFDFPGTGDSFSIADEKAGLQLWHDAIKVAADELYARTRYERLIVIAQSLGALVASEVLSELPKFHGCVLINPVMSGRQYLREVALWSSVIDDNLEIPREQRDRLPGSIAGLTMQGEIARDIKGRNFRRIEARAPISLLVMQPGLLSAMEREQLAADANIDFEVTEFPGFRDMIANVTISKVPVETVEKLVEWVCQFRLPKLMKRAILSSSHATPQLKGDGFVEAPIRFGPTNNLSGMLCSAEASRLDTAVLFLTTAYERHASWGGMHLQLARLLAKQGITSLRFDAAGVADSPSRPGAPEQILYSDWLKADVGDAIDFLESKGYRKVVLAARCSGGYVAFQTALNDQRVRGLVTVNQDAFFWPEGKPIDELLKFVPKDFHKYATKLFDYKTLKRVWNGDVDLPAALKNMMSEILRRCGNFMEPFVVFDQAQSEAIRKTRAGFKTLAKRNVVFSLLYGEGDIGLRAIDEVFGRTFRKVQLIEKVDFKVIPDCDHNLSRPNCRQIYFEAIKSAVKRTSVQKEERPNPVVLRSFEVVGSAIAGIAAGLHSFEL